MIEKAFLTQMLQEFFDQQIKDGLQTRFIDSLTSDFDIIMKDFNSFIAHKCLGLDRSVDNINFHDAAVMLTQEVTAFKIQAIKFHHNILTEAAEYAKKMTMREKRSAH